MNVKKYAPTILSLRVNNIYYGLALIEKGDDESLYLKFPRKNPYNVKSKNEFKNVPKNITLEKNENCVQNPYFSYHQSGIIHINSQTLGGEKNKYVLDKLTAKKLDLLQKKEFIPFCSVLFPVNIRNYDLINHLKISSFNYHEISDTPLYQDKSGLTMPSIIVVDINKLPKNAILYIEIFIHKKLNNTEKLSFRPEQKSNLLEQITLDNQIGTLSYTCLIKFIQPDKENPLGEIITNIFNIETLLTLSIY